MERVTQKEFPNSMLAVSSFRGKRQHSTLKSTFKIITLHTALDSIDINIETWRTAKEGRQAAHHLETEHCT